MSAPNPEPPEATLLRLIAGYRVTQGVYVVTKLGIPDLLGDAPMDARSLAEATGADPDRLYRLMRALVTSGLFFLDESDRFGLTEVGSLLRNDSTHPMAPVALFAGEEAYRAWGDLLHTVRTGATAFDHLYGAGHFEYLESHPEAAATFHRLMAWTVGLQGFPLAEVDFGDHRVVVDVGGGRGALLAAILQSHAHLTGILFDRAAAVQGAPELLRGAGVEDRCTIVVGSAFESIPRGGDLYVMSRILHDWPDDRARELLKNCRRAMETGATLLLLDGVLRERLPPPSRAWLDLVMMVMTGGRERTEEEWRALLEGAGFSLLRVRPSRTNQDLLEARAV